MISLITLLLVESAVVLFHILNYIFTGFDWPFVYIVYSVFYGFGRFLILLFFVGRLYYVFMGTQYALTKNRFILFIIINVLNYFYFVGMGAHLLYEIVLGKNNPIKQIGLGILYMSIDMISYIYVVRLFTKNIKSLMKNLQTMNKNKQKDSNNELCLLSNKYLFLTKIAILSTIIVIMMASIIELVSNQIYGFRSYWYFYYPVFHLDSLINFLCIQYTLGYKFKDYKKYCLKYELFFNCKKEN